MAETRLLLEGSWPEDPWQDDPAPGAGRLAELGRRIRRRLPVVVAAVVASLIMIAAILSILATGDKGTNVRTEGAGPQATGTSALALAPGPAESPSPNNRPASEAADAPTTSTETTGSSTEQTAPAESATTSTPSPSVSGRDPATSAATSTSTVHGRSTVVGRATSTRPARSNGSVATTGRSTASGSDTSLATRPPTTAPSGSGPTTATTSPSLTTRPTTGSTARETTTTIARTTTVPVTTAPPATTPTTPAPTTTAPTPTSTAPTTTATTAPTTSTVDPGPSGRLVWSDDFNQLDTGRWALEHSTYGDGNNELQCYRPDNVSVSGGKLVLRAVTETYTCPNGSTRSVTSGMVRSRGVSFEPGQALEFRVKLTPGDESDQGGLWPAVWSSGWAGGGWPRAGELDFLEVMTANDPKRSVYSIHYAKSGGGHGVTNKPVFSDRNFSADWHVVRFEYGTAGRLAWFLDGRQVFAVDAADTVQGYPAPFNQAINEIKINLALGGRPGPLSPRAVGSNGARFEVDYVRVYQL